MIGDLKDLCILQRSVAVHHGQAAPKDLTHTVQVAELTSVHHIPIFEFEKEIGINNVHCQKDQRHMFVNFLKSLYSILYIIAIPFSFVCFIYYFLSGLLLY